MRTILRAPRRKMPIAVGFSPPPPPFSSGTEAILLSARKAGRDELPKASKMQRGTF